MKKTMTILTLLLTMVFGVMIYESKTFTDEEIVEAMLKEDFDNDNFEVEILGYDEETDDISYISYLDGKMRWGGTVDKSWAKSVYCK